MARNPVVATINGGNAASAPATTQTKSGTISATFSGPNGSASEMSDAPLGAPSRSGRGRGSLPTPTQPDRALRAVPPRDIEKVKQRLGADGIKERRDELVKEKEEALRAVVDGHDTLVREKFHLERYISLLEGWDPVSVKQEQSPVFLDYVREHHNLLDLIPPSSGQNAVAGPSRPRTSLPSRQTRRQIHEKSELIAAPAPAAASSPAFTAANVKGKGKGQAEEAGTETPLKGKGKTGTSSLNTGADTSRQAKGKRPQVSAAEMPPPPVPSKAKGRRATLGAQHEVADEVDAAERAVSDKEKGKKRGRMSLPNVPAKKLRSGSLDLAKSSSPALGSPSVEPEAYRERQATPLPSLAHLPFPPPPPRPRERVYGPKQVWYTDPNQLPPTDQKFGGSVADLLESYILIEDSGPSPTLESLQARAEKEGFYRNRVNWLQHQGRLLRLIEEAEAEADQIDASLGKPTRTKPAALAPRQTDFQDSLLSHVVQVRTAMMNEAKSKPVVCKRIARMVAAYWEHEQNKEERERLAEERDRKKKAKDVVRALRRRWALAVKIVRAKILQQQKEEQDRLGKEHLQNMLWRSSGLLEGQRGVIMGEAVNDAQDSDVDSEGTDEVSAADTSDEEDESGDDDDDVAGERDGQTDDENDIEPMTSDIDMERSSVANDVGSEHAGNDDKNDEGVNDEDEALEGSSSDESQDEEDERGSEVDQSHLVALLLDENGTEQTELPSQPAVDTDVLETDPVDLRPGDVSELEQTTELDAQTTGTLSRAASEEAGSALVNDAPILSVQALVSAVEAMPDTSQPMRTSHTAQAAPGDIEMTGLARTDLSGQSDVPNGKRAEALHLQAPEDASSAKVNGHDSPVTDPSPPVYRPRPRRARTSRSHSATIKTEDPDADDVEFKDEADLSDQDRQMDVEMERNDADDDSEDAGLLADADLPIEELLKRYGYAAPGSEEQPQPAEDGMDVDPPLESSKPSDSFVTDKSLTDDALGKSEHDGLIIEGKRNRRVRSVWTPEDNPAPPPPAPKRPKIEEVESEAEPTPSLTSEETDEDDEDEEEQFVDEDLGKIRPPFLLRGTLRPYQQAGLEWLASLYANKMNGILADEMGLGKTIQTIALLGHLACDKGVWGQHLIIVPTSVILNWEMEFKKFLPGFKVLTYYGNQKERKEKRKGWHTENTWQVCITSYQIVLADQHIFRRKNWVYMILDEAHNIKNFRSQRWQTLLGFKAARRLLLTGTPLQNNLMELWSLLYFLMPNGVGADATAVVGFANHKEFSEWFSNPMDKAIETGDALDEETLETVAKLHTLLRPFILRRLKSEVETQLPGKFEHVVYCKLSKRQRFLYDEFMSRASTREALTSGGYLGVVNTLMQLRKVCNHPDLFEVRPVRTSFAMERSVLADFEPSEVLVRKRLLDTRDDLSLEAYNLLIRRDDESSWACQTRQLLDASHLLPYAVEMTNRARPIEPPNDTRTIDGWAAYQKYMNHQASVARWKSLSAINKMRCQVKPIYGSTFLDLVSGLPNTLLPQDLNAWSRKDMIDSFVPPFAPLIHSFEDRAKQVSRMLDYYAVIPPNAVARDVPQYALPGLQPTSHPALLEPEFDTLHQATVKLQIAFPDLSLLQYDCGKLQKLDEMLRDLKADGHRVLIFTQMTRVLDILETFLSYNGHRYLRLDGSTKIEDRQVITERFNSDPRIFCFIASSRSGGVGINLTGADTVFFYDSDWNPSMDRQCMDRAHRIGQTREVHIYRFVSIHTVEENMLKKANQKRLLDRVVIQEGDFTTEFFGKMDWRDIIDTPAGMEGHKATKDKDEDERVEDIAIEGEPIATEVEAEKPRVGEEREFAKALAEVEDEEDAAAARVAQGENELDFAEFEEGVRRPTLGGQSSSKGRVSFRDSAEGSATPMEVDAPGQVEGEVEARAEEDGEGEGEEDGDEDVGAVDEYMLKWVEEDWDWFIDY